MMAKAKKLGSELLFLSVSQGDVHNIIQLIEEDEVDINWSNINGQTALHFAVSAKNIKIVGKNRSHFIEYKYMLEFNFIYFFLDLMLLIYNINILKCSNINLK